MRCLVRQVLLDARATGMLPLTFAFPPCSNTPLYYARTKFNSGCGWPAFDTAIPGAVLYIEDHSHGMRRVETRCAACNSHLGHVFEDGPVDTTGERYCINSVCLIFVPEKTTK